MAHGYSHVQVVKSETSTDWISYEVQGEDMKGRIEAEIGIKLGLLCLIE